MTYAEFQAAAVAELDVVHADLIVFAVPNAVLFQTIRADPGAYLAFMQRLMADQGVSETVKLGAAAAMMDLPPDALAGFVDDLLRLAETDPALMDIVLRVVFNTYRGSSFGDASLIAPDALTDHAGRPAVHAVLGRLWAHPALPADERMPGMPLAELFAGR
jgi:hypothetical protein